MIAVSLRPNAGWRHTAAFQLQGGVVRLGMVREILQVQRSALTVSLVGQSGGTTQLRGLQACLRAVRIIQGTGVLQAETQHALKDTALANAVVDDVSVPSEAAQRFVKAVETIESRAGALVAALNDLVPKEDPFSVFLKLPEKPDLQSMGDLFERLETLLNQVLVVEGVGGAVKLGQFDVGSRWVQVLLGTALALEVLANVVKVAEGGVALRAKASANQLMIEELEMDLEAKRTTLSAITAQAERIEAEQLREVQTKAGVSDNDHEYFERLRFVVGELRELQKDGLEVHPSLTAPIAIRLDFPAIVPLLEPLKLTRQLEQSDENTE